MNLPRSLKPPEVYSQRNSYRRCSTASQAGQDRRIITVSYQFPDNDSFDIFKKMLAELRCPFQSESVTHTVSFQQKDQGKFDEAAAKLRMSFIFEIE